MDLTAKLAAALDDHIIENFADIYTLEDELAKLERKHDLEARDVIAAIATCADVASAQQRLIARTPKALAAGLARALERGGLRVSAELMVRALLAGAQRELAAPAAPASPASKAKPPPRFARPEWLPALVEPSGRTASRDDVLAVLAVLRTARLADRDALDAARARYTAASLGAFGRALAEGWLSHGAPPAERWGVHAAGHLPDDDGARALATMAVQLAPRVGQFSKAQDLVDVLAAMGTRTALELLQHLATTVKTRSVRDRARAAFDAVACTLGTTTEDLADRLLPAEPTAKQVRDFVRRLEARMVEGSTIALQDLVESVLLSPRARAAAAGVVFAVRTRRALGATFTIAGDALVDVAGEPAVPPRDAQLVVAHPLDLPAKARTAWQRRLPEQPFPQLARPVERFASVAALRSAVRALRGLEVQPRRLFALEALGWRRGATPGGRFTELTRELGGVTATLAFEPGVTLARGMSTPQRITSVGVRGTSAPIALAELRRELATLEPRG